MQRYLVINSAYESHTVGIIVAKTEMDAKRKFVLAKSFSCYAFYFNEWDTPQERLETLNKYLTDPEYRHYTKAYLIDGLEDVTLESVFTKGDSNWYDDEGFKPLNTISGYDGNYTKGKLSKDWTSC